MPDLAPGFTVTSRVPRPVEEVFAAIVDPARLCAYFTESASGPLETGAHVEWAWAGGVHDTVFVDEVLPPSRIVFRWRAHQVQSITHVQIDLQEENGATIVRISENGWDSDEAGLASSYEHCAGWQHMVLCLKAWLVHGIDLRA